jgi:hypothetical protein
LARKSAVASGPIPPITPRKRVIASSQTFA